MAQQYFKAHAGQVDPDIVARADALLQKGTLASLHSAAIVLTSWRAGYEKLRSFEVEGGGYEWFGGAPAHESLTAYGLLQFVEMARVRSVDGDMIARTKVSAPSSRSYARLAAHRLPCRSGC